jgi:hypothetical protein
MTRIEIDPALGQRLHQVTEPVELCDESGAVLGRFVPAVDMGRFEPVTPDLTLLAMEQRRQSTEWFSTAEVLRHLESQ